MVLILQVGERWKRRGAHLEDLWEIGDVGAVEDPKGGRDVLKVPRRRRDRHGLVLHLNVKDLGLLRNAAPVAAVSTKGANTAGRIADVGSSPRSIAQ